jgi:Cdc37 Hsp90 binding domain/Cdc37 N terminal kinase binding/Cdc37 C terminal domain
MSAGKIFDYSKWDKIELSDDESDLHPNIDKDSWFRLKHRTRLEREEKEDAEIKVYQKENAENQARLAIIKARLNGLKSGQADEDAEFEDIDALVGEADELERLIQGRNKRIEEIQERRKWNIDNICKVSEEKTVVNSANTAKSLRAEDFKPVGLTEKAFPDVAKVAKTAEESLNLSDTPNAPVAKPAADSSSSASKPPAAPVTKAATATATAAATSTASASSSAAKIPGPKQEEKVPVTGSGNRERFAVISYNDFVIMHEAILEEYSEIRDLDATKEYLFKHCDVLLHEHGQSYMLLSSLEDEMNGKRERMKLVSRQSQILSHITELATSMKRDPRDVVLPFFKRISEPEYLQGFNQALSEFIERIIKRAVEKRKEMDAEDADEDDVPLGPGGLNPYKVLALLPKPLKEAFESQQIEKLHKAISEMTPADAKHYMKMCVDSGLWVAKDDSIFVDEGEEGEEDDSEAAAAAAETDKLEK